MAEATAGITPSGVYTLREACRFLRISEATARRWIKGGRLPARKIGRDYRLLGSDVLDVLQVESRGWRPFGPGHPLLGLVGIGDSGLEDISEEHDRYLAEEARGEA